MNIKIHNWIGLAFLMMLPLSGCGDDDTSVVFIDPNAPATVSVTASAVALESDSVEIVATVLTPKGGAVADGTTVACQVSDPDAALSAASADTAGGLAAFNLTHAPLVGVNSQTATVTCTAGFASGSTDVKFITQPTSVEVFIGFDQAVTDLAALQFVLNNTTGATFDNGAQLISAVNAATGSSVAANFNGTDSTTIGLISAGFNTGTEPIIQATYGITTGLPTFSVAPPPATFIAQNPDLVATTPPVTAANVVVTVTYNTEL